MPLQQTITHLINQLTVVLQQLTPQQYSTKLDVLLKASIGEHVRHTIELFTALHTGYNEGTVNYENRKRDYTLQSNNAVAITALQLIEANCLKPNKPLTIVTGDCNDILIESNYYRELLYNIEHTIHHMALIRIGVEQTTTIAMNNSFGVAASTIKYKTQCAP